jgi:hypothetical protein
MKQRQRWFHRLRLGEAQLADGEGEQSERHAKECSGDGPSPPT